MAMTRDNYSDRQKAAIFARDRAMCCYSGKSLWLLDYGAAPALVDQVDHVIAASKGGTSAQQNGVLATFMHNYLRGSSKRPLQLFEGGLPNLDAFWVLGSISDDLLDHICRFEALHYSDWYINRAIASMRFAAAKSSQPKRVDGLAFSRDAAYHSKAAIGRLRQWRQIVNADGVPSLQARGLMPVHPRDDHMPFVELLEADTDRDVLALARQAEPFLNASYAAIENMFSLPHSEGAMRAYADRIMADPFVVQPTKQAVTRYIRRIIS
jgi:hypothetical protein